MSGFSHDAGDLAQPGLESGAAQVGLQGRHDLGLAFGTEAFQPRELGQAPGT
jgi:hypothetical protein